MFQMPAMESFKLPEAQADKLLNYMCVHVSPSFYALRVQKMSVFYTVS
jgi:hypothetical protein